MIPYITGFLLLALSAHANITSAHDGTYTSAGALIIIGLAIGIAVGSVYSGKAWAARRFPAAIAIALAVLICEGFSFGTTAERIVGDRDQAQLPFAENQARRAEAKRILDQAISDQSALSSTSPRLTDALKAAATAEQASRDKASDKHCAANCAQLLTAQMTAASAEVTKAREELAIKAKAAADAVVSARAAHDAIKATRSSTPLADKLRIQPWKLDLLMAALASLGLNGLAACLLAYGAHSTREQSADEPTQLSEPTSPALTVAAPLTIEHEAVSVPVQVPVQVSVPAQVPTPEPELEHSPVLANPSPRPAVRSPAKPTPAQKPRVSSPTKLIHDFALARVRPSPTAHIFLDDLSADYKHWCAAHGHPPADDRLFASTMSALFTSVGLKGTFINNRPAISGVALLTRLSSAA
jgi:hypothetical protein